MRMSSNLTRRSLLRASLGIAAAAGSLARPYIANAQAKTATVWWVQGFIPEEDDAFRQLVADYEKASGNTLDYSITPFAPLRQKFISAITSGEVPDLVEPAYGPYVAQQAWDDKLADVSDVIDTHKSRYCEAALLAAHCYNNAMKRRSYYGIPWAGAVILFHVWGDLVEKAGYKVSDIPNRWDAFIDFFKPMQKKLQAQGMNHTYSYGFEISTVGGDPVGTFNHFLIAYGGERIVTRDGQLHSRDPQVREAATRALDKLATLYKEGYIPRSSVNWNDQDDNNAFHSKLCVMDFDGSLSTELAMYHDKQAYDHDMITQPLPLSNEGKKLPSIFGIARAVIPKGAKNIAVAKDFAKYFSQPEVSNRWLKAGLARNLPVMPEIAKNDPWWTKSTDPHRAPYVKQGLFDPTIPSCESYNPAWAQVASEHVFNMAMADIWNGELSAKQAADKALARCEELFAKYPIRQA
jgi:multiple sugar transport system substrate-binding protein